MTKHTPGPWAVGSQVMGDGFNLWSDSTGGVVAWVEPRHNFEDEETGEMIVNPPDMTQHPDARLIAAAPDLLAALEMAVATIERIAPKHGPFSSVDGTLSVARAAISKADGRG